VGIVSMRSTRRSNTSRVHALQPSALLGECVGTRPERVRAIPGLWRGDPQDHRHHQQHRIAQRPLPPGGPGRGHFPTDQAALNCLYPVTRSLDPTGRGKARWVIRWKAALKAFAITFEGRISPSNN